VKPDLVADVGNSRVKWGVVAPDGRSVAAVLSLPDDPDVWREALSSLALRPRSCVLASVRPQRSERLAAWLEAEGLTVRLLHKPDDLPLKTNVVEPRHVGIDRLLNGVAALRRLKPGEPAILADAGSAVTVDWLDESHIYRGGTIFPGLRLMAEALHNYTALLPLVKIAHPVPEVPAPDTILAMEAGIFHAVVGGIECIARLLAERASVPPRLFVTGGDGPLLASALSFPTPPLLWPEMTLEGILYSAEGLAS
jgi:type III pantothenate kinase